jgi:hypothetical protein
MILAAALACGAAAAAAPRAPVLKDLAGLKRTSGKAWAEGIDKSIRDLRAGLDEAVKN